MKVNKSKEFSKVFDRWIKLEEKIAKRRGEDIYDITHSKAFNKLVKDMKRVQGYFDKLARQ